MTDLELDLAELRAAKSRVETALSTFQNAERVGDDVGALTGDRRLAGKVEDFAGNWDYNRGKLEEQLTTVRDWLQAIDETMTELDASMAAASDADGTP